MWGSAMVKGYMLMVDRDQDVQELDHRTVLVRGRFRHDQEMLIGPRMRDGEQGYHIVTPMERDNGYLSLSPDPLHLC